MVRAVVTNVALALCYHLPRLRVNFTAAHTLATFFRMGTGMAPCSQSDLWTSRIWHHTRATIKSSSLVCWDQHGASTMKKLSLIFVLFGASLCHAQGTYTAASCKQSDVNAVINGPTHTAVNGDTIIIPTTGSPCTWTSGITISGVGIDITGTGTPNTGGGTVGAGTPSTTLIDNASAPLFTFTGLTSGETAKVELLTMSASGAGSFSIPAAITFLGTCTTGSPYCASVRVDNLTFTTGTWESALLYGFVAVDDVFGVIDHNTANEATGAGTPVMMSVNYSAWQGVGEWGDNSFASADSFGTAQAMYLENNSIAGVRGSDVPGGLGSDTNWGGGRYVCRFNSFDNMAAGICPGHGTAWTGRPRGQRQVEVYYNNMTVGNGSCTGMTNLLGGTARFLSNSVSDAGAGCQEFVGMDIPRFEKNSGPWNSCDGTQPWDQSPWSSTTACLDQPGSRAGLLYSTDDPPTMASSPGTACSTAGQCWLNPMLDPVYEAGDVMTAGSLGSPITIVSSGASTRVLANRDYYAEVSQSVQTSATSPFNGTTGTGYGTLALRPTTCTPYVGYWAIDQGTWNTYNSSQEGELFICTATNAWTMGYEPYTYPHPLTAGGTSGSGGNPPNPPTDLTATVN
jgi:hypothetical protein